MTMTTTPVTDAELLAFCVKLANKHAAYFAEHLTNLTAPTFTFKKGSKYAKIVRHENCGSGVSVVCFVELATALIWKAASWKAPAKNFSRGNVRSSNPYTDGVNIYSC